MPESSSRLSSRQPDEPTLFDVAPPLPPSSGLPDGEVTLAEIACELVCLRGDASDDAVYKAYAKAQGVSYPHVTVLTDAHDAAAMGAEATSLPRSALKRPEHSASTSRGLDQAALREVLARLLADSPSWVAKAADRTVHLWHTIRAHWHSVFALSRQLPASEPGARHPHLAWHPYRNRFAVALPGAAGVRVFDLDTCAWSSAPVRAEVLQNCGPAAWRPCAGATLAVAVEGGIALWTFACGPDGAPPSGSVVKAESAALLPRRTVQNDTRLRGGVNAGLRASMRADADDDMSKRSFYAGKYGQTSAGASAGPSASTAGRSAARGAWAQFVAAPAHARGAPSALAWSPDGALIAACARGCGTFVHDVARRHTVVLHVPWSDDPRAVAWSPSGAHLAVGCERGVRVFTTENWRSTLWSTSSTVSAVVFSGDGRTLLVTRENSSEIMCFNVAEYAVDFLETFDVGAVATDSLRLGGAIRSIALDGTGSRLLLSFNRAPDEDPKAYDGRELVAVHAFHRTRASARFVFRGWIRGPPTAKTPVQLTFRPGYPRGALATVLWDTGRVTFIPMHFDAGM